MKKNYFEKNIAKTRPWDHAQIIEHKMLCNLAERKPLYDQTRPSFLHFEVSSFVSCKGQIMRNGTFPSNSGEVEPLGLPWDVLATALGPHWRPSDAGGRVVESQQVLQPKHTKRSTH